MTHFDAPLNRGITLTLEQTTWWYAQDGYPVRVVDMELEYLTNLLAFLRRRAAHLQTRARYHRAHVAAARGTPPSFRRELDAVAPLDWLNDRPLIHALEERRRRLTSVDGEVVSTAADLPPATQPRLAGGKP